MTASVQTHHIDDSDAGSRLDVYLQAQHADVSRSRLQSLISAGEVTVNERTVRPSHRLKAGDCVTLRVPEPVELAAVAEPIPLDIVYEDDALLVVDKPAGMAVHPAPGTPSGTLVNALLAHCTDLSGINGVLRPGIVHRLDRDTTGLLVVAKSDTAHRVLASQLEQRSMDRRYLALAWGRIEAARRIEAPLARHPKDRLRMAVVDGGRHAVTHVTPVEAHGALTRVELKLETGRTHQIRVHLQHVGHPVFGDPVYGGRNRVEGVEPSMRRALRSALALIDRQALHAQQLGFDHPDGRRLAFTSEPPDDLARVLQAARAL